MQDRNQKIQNVIESLEKDLELLCLTGVEDKTEMAEDYNLQSNELLSRFN